MTGKRIGLVIGNNYPNSNKELRFAVADAIKMKEVLLDKDICEFDEVEESIDDTFVDARIKIEKILKNANHDDLVFIYFSGHGKKHLDNGLRLLFKDAREDFPLATSLNFDYINRCMRYPSLKSVIIVLDCCYSGVAGIKGDDLEETLSNYSSGSGTVILTSTGLIGSSKAKEDAELKHGIFTNYLLEGLENGGADEDEDGLIYVDDLYEYARSRTIKRSSQSPVMKTQMEGKILIAKNPLKVKKNNFISKRDKLVEIYDDGLLPPNVFDISMIVLVDAYEKPDELTKSDEKIRKSLENLLEGKISVKSYIPTVQSYLKNEKIEASYILEKFRNTEIPKTFISPSTDMEFVLIPAGKFMMGSPSEEQGRYDDEDPVHEVTIKNSYYMGKCPVTQNQWKKVMGNNPSNFKGEDRPVESVSWVDVHEFVTKLNKSEGADKYRLPSEAEWEYACRAGTTTSYSFDDDESKLKDYCWYSGYSTYEEWNKNTDKISKEGKTHPIGQKKPNPWGLYDMHGNVLEWVQDCYHSSYESAPSYGNAWEDGNSSDRVIRGGSWSSLAKSCRSAFRLGNNPSDRVIDVGFRLLRKL